MYKSNINFDLNSVRCACNNQQKETKCLIRGYFKSDTLEVLFLCGNDSECNNCKSFGKNSYCSCPKRISLVKQHIQEFKKPVLAY